ncbi:Mcm10 replication factor [Ancylostoma duodenale]|uniref:Mcm10 replication factor n=1 Tax=Ancylostoma duodenale TaxID=51022 RepID=A0A0C2C713_9BILA|nr:Mcm10 replication factor [Ancylostoma duodenale]
MIAVVESRKGHIAGKSKKSEGQFSMAEFIKKQEASSVPSTSHMPQLGYGLRAGQDVSLATRNANAAKAQGIAAQKHLDVLEQREKVETFVTECMSVKDVKVVTCKKCDYTAQKQSELCKSEGHTVKYTTAEKRFFKCGACHKRTVVFSMLPTKPCKHCAANEWVRVAMKDERKVKLENEQLLLRGEERKFVNA